MALAEVVVVVKQLIEALFKAGFWGLEGKRPWSALNG